MINKKLLSLLVVISLGSTLSAQNTVNYNLNAMVIQGEASGGNIVSDDMGLGVGLGYDFPFVNPRFEFALKFDYVWMNIDYIVDKNPSNISFMTATIHHVGVTGGLNVYLGQNHNMANLYRPFRPYTYMLAGLVAQDNSLSFSENFNFPSVQGLLILPILEVGGGAKVRINPEWSFNAVIGFRSTFSDDVDALVGSTGAPDIMGIFRIGVSRRM